MRVQLARRFHNDAVTDVRRVRRKTVVRLFRLAGHADLPATVEFDDELPPASATDRARTRVAAVGTAWPIRRRDTGSGAGLRDRSGSERLAAH